MSFSTLCHERFSARKYIDKKVEEEKLSPFWRRDG